MTRSRWFLVLSAATTALAMGCEAPPSDDAESSEAAQTVTPTGTNGRATVTVNVPSFFSPAFVVEGESYAYTLVFNGTEVKPGKPTLVTPAANAGNWGCLETVLNRVQFGRLTRVARGQECIWQLASGKSLTIDLGVGKVWWSGYPQVRGDVLAVAPPSGATVSRVWQSSRYAQYQGTSRYAFYARNDVPLLLVPGDYEYATSSAAYPAKPFTISAGQQTDFNADYDAFLATVNVAYAAAEMPDVGGITGSSITCGGASGPIRGRPGSQLVMLDRDTMSCDLKLGGGGVSAPLALTRGQTTSIALGRLDVDDVVLEDEGNRRVTGAFNVRARVGAGWGPWILKTASATRHGLDLPKGHYQVEVTFTAAVGAKTSFYEADLD